MIADVLCEWYPFLTCKTSVVGHGENILDQLGLEEKRIKKTVLNLV